MTHLTLITGASRGMGLAMARQRLDAGHELLCIARHTSADLQAHADALGLRCEQWAQDLSDAPGAARRLETWLLARGPQGLASVTLINNAARIPRIAPLGDIDAQDLADALRVGLEAPMLLAGAFLRATAGWPVPRKLLNISSGLGRRAMASQAAYCAVKAGMDHFTRCLALEEARPGGARVCSLAPGVIDTDMQRELRGADSALFADRQGFEDLHRRGQLASAQDAAARVLARLDRGDFGAEPVADVRG